ncbi:ABC transporter permease [Chelatococcus composti]|jgi:ABC-type nitrate/sulfonate/bicarbonate transport system, permease component|uniref:Sulfonate transport system permease protein n=1 Tax=Chelatococcus composti TaxID=1743235 RepID=A0A841KC95_9HYPH|nr:ABC transporter permease [Chelatococcus composti]MBB6169002.1 sulfonate transport system permease protein [Chelatococcus composti]MBS7737604.1 ABC transporter permease [Chelatococcus composti]PZN42370.1 MAG: ABC transporter permease [Pseudomonadota bacterium]GGG44538.1 ABC transporter permease [Chelatococcus composti]
MTTPGLRRHTGAACVLIVLAAAWWLASASGLVSPFLLPLPQTVLATGWELLADGTLGMHVAVSVGRILAGYSLAVALALPLAFLFGISPAVRQAFEPVLEFLRQVPPLAMMPLLILWLGIGEAQKVGIIVLACFFPIFLGALGGIAQCDPKLVEVGRVCGLRQWDILRRIVLPAALPSIVIGLRIALGQGWRALVGAELVASAAGLGYMIVDAEQLARTDIVIVGIFVIGTLGLLADFGVRRLIARTAPWLRQRTELTHA